MKLSKMGKIILSLAFTMAVLSGIVQAQDTTAPEIFNCPTQGIFASVDNLADRAEVTWTEPTATDNSGQTVTVTQTHSPPTTFGVGFTAVTYVFRDTSNNPAVCSFIVSVGLNGDTNPPVISGCPTDFTIFVANTNTLGTPTWTAPTATDETGQTQFSTNLSPLTSLAVGTYPVSYVFNDPSGNEDQCDFVVTIAVGTPDTTSPVLLTCPSDITVGNNGQSFVQVTWDAPTAFDNSGVINILSGPSSTSQFYQAGTSSTISYDIYDPSGNMITCAFQVTVAALGDTTAPVISNCPANINAVLNVGETQVSVFWTEPTATDESGPVTTTRSAVPGQSFSLGSTTVTYTFTDSSGNFDQCSFVVTVFPSIDNTDPVVVSCPESFSVDAGNNAFVFVFWDEPVVTDDSNIVTQIAGPSSNNGFYPAGTVNTVTYRFADAAGNEASCIFDITVVASVDNTDPVITGCPSNIVVQTTLDGAAVSVTWTEPTATDDSGVAVSVNQNANPGDAFNVGAFLVTYVFTDEAGNNAICSFEITVAASIDNMGPQITGCPNDIMVNSVASNNQVSVTWLEPTATDDSGVVPTVISTSSPGDLFVIGSTVVSYTFVDGSGNPAVCSFTITVIDANGPVISNCPMDISISVPFGTSSASVTWTPPTATDNSGGNVIVTSTSNPGDVFNLGLTEVSYTFTDAQGNPSVCNFNVIVLVEGDQIDPVITGCPTNIMVDSDSTTNGATVQWIEPTATDNDGNAPSVSRTSAPGSTFQIGSTTVSYTFTDTAGNLAICSFDVIVNDNSAPIISDCPTDISLTVPFGTTSTAVTWTAPTAVDNSGGLVTSTSTSSPGDTFLVGMSQVVYIFNDQENNPAVCAFNIIIQALGDTTDPVISDCPPNLAVTADMNLNGAFVTWTPPTAMDNSGTVNTVFSASPNDFFPIGETTVTYTFTDNAGNNAICSFNIVVSDDTDPIISNCPSDITLEVPFGVTEAAVTWTAPSATDNSGFVTLTSNSDNPGDSFPVGNTQVSYIFTDNFSNNAICAFNIFIVALGDTTRPVVSDCPTTIVVEASDTLPGASVDWTTPTAVDNDGNPVQVTFTNSQGFFSIGTTTVTYTFTDTAGNQETCVFDVVVIDNVDPVITSCPSNIVLDVPFGTTETAVSWPVPGATDNSGNVDVNNNFNPGDVFTAGTSTSVTYTFTDGNNNFAVCSFLVTINIGPDMTDPVISDCPTNIVEFLPEDASAIVIQWTVPTATDNSGVVPAVINTANSGDAFTLGTTEVSYTFRDQTGNEAICTFTVTIIDQTGPTFLFCPTDITLVVSLGTPVASVTWQEPVPQDNSGTVNLITQSASPGDDFPAGQTTTVTYLYQDESGNPATCTFNVIINTVDDQRPVIDECPPNIAVEVEIGTGGTRVTWAAPTATDNSGLVPNVENNFNPGDFFDVGSTVVIYTFTDNGGNEVQCAFTVAVTGVDTTPPVIQFCPTNIALTTDITTNGIVVDWTAPVVADASGDPISIVVSKAPNTFFDVGTTEVMYTFVDSSGNSISCSFDVTVTATDEEGPMITGCPNDITRTVLDDTTGGIITWTLPVAADNSGEPAQLLTNPLPPGSFFPVGTTVINYRYQDAAGNIEECSFDIVIDQDSPCNDSPCENGGVCLAQSLTNYVCVCPGCFTGVNCQIELDPCDGNTCSNGGQCVQYENSCTQYYCECPSCFYGEFCQNRVDACACNKCENGGVCLPAVQGGSCTEYSCLCTGCFVGQFCQNEYNPCDNAPCQNNGICTNIDDSCSAYSCECQGCFTGYNCDIAIPDPCDADPCANGGACSRIPGSCYSYQCACLPGFAGPRCEDAMVILANPCNNFPCENGASCVCDNAQNYVCLCPPGFNGIHCEIGLISSQDACANNPCSNGGNCINSYHSDSEVLGVYNPQYTCICADGFTGTNCALTTANNPSLVVCDDSKCQNGGVCSNTFYSYDQSVSYYCDCPIGFFGECCELVHPDPCDSNPCTANGNCLAFNTYFVCSCINGYSGVTCEVPPNDVTRPVLVCSDDVVVPATTTSGGAVVTWPTPIVTDNSGNWGFVSVNGESGAYYPIGTNRVVTYNYIDGAGNVETCSFTISVVEVDNVDPVVESCPEDIEITLPPGGVSTVVSWLTPSASDNFAVVNTDSNFQPGAEFSLGVTVVTYTFTDAAGNFAECVFSITVIAEPDVVAPVITNCPGDLDIEVGPGVTSSVATWIEPSATDNVGIVAMTNNFNPGSIFTVGTTVVTYTFADAAGNPATCSFDVTVIVGEDLIAPIIQNCPGNIAIFVSVGISETAVTWIEPSAVDNSIGAISMVNTFSPGDVFQLGATLVSYTFTDLAGNEATCEFFVGITVAVDDEDPIISGCPNDVVLSVASGVSMVTASWIPPTATDNSGSFDTVSNFVPGAVFPLGSTAVTYTFTDPSGNFAVCAFNIRVSVAGDNIPPEITNCPGAISVEVSASVGSATISWLEPTAEDDFGIVLTNQNFAPGQLFQTGSTSVTYTFTDQAGNTAVCSFVVTVTTVDDIAPVIIGCPNTITYEAPLGATRAPVTWNAPSSTEPNVVFTQTAQPGSLFPLGSTQVSYTFTDLLGNSATCSFTVVVINAMDNTRPVISDCPDDVNVRVDVGLTQGTATWALPSAMDDSGSVTFVSNFNPGDSFDLGSTLVAYTFSDAEGNTAVCDFFVIVTAESDNDEPIITGCPDDVTIYVPIGTTRANVFWTEPTATDQYGDVTVTRSSTPGSLFVFGQSTVTYTFRDEANNVAFCIFDVFVQVAPTDVSAPALLSCPDDITVATSDANTAVPASWLVPQAVDDSGVVTVINTNNPEDLFSLGTTVVTYTFTDNAGNFVNCEFNVNVILGVIDTTDPIITGCPDNIEILTPVGDPTVEVTWNEPSGFDNSGNVRVTQNASPGDSFSEGPTQVVYQFTDPSGNDAFCIFTVTVTLDVQTDFDGPVISGCPSDLVLSVPTGIAVVAATWVEPSATDASLPITLDQSASPGDEFAVGQSTLVTYTFTDAFGNPSVCAFNVIITVSVDNTDPVISNCPDDITLSVPAGLATIALTWTEPTATDDTTANLDLVQSAAPGDSFVSGQSTVVSYTFTDDAGNFAVCAFTVTINVIDTDTTDPVISGCPSDISLSVGAGVTAVPVTWTEPTATDETSAVTVDQSHQPGDSFNLGPTLVSYIFTDAAGNNAFCTFTVTISTSVVVDTTDPVVSNCPEAISLSVGAGVTSVPVTWTEPTAVDETSAVDVTQNFQPGDLFGLGVNIVSYTFTDQAGNDASCIFTITVQAATDNTSPTVSGCPNDITVAAGQAANTVVTWTEPTATDVSEPITTNVNLPSGSSFPVGTTTVIYTFTDAVGNLNFCFFDVTVVAPSDQTAPQISDCPSDINVTVPSGLNETTVTWTEPTAMDDSGTVNTESNFSPGDTFRLGTTIVTYNFTDGSGNFALCSFSITLNAASDTTPPVISNCPNDISLTLPAGTTSVPLTWTEPTAVDETSAVTTTRSAAPGDLFTAGTSTIVSYTFTDAAGNFDVCSFTVTLIASTADNTPPDITGCPSNINAFVNAGVTGTAVTWTPPTATDLVSAVTFTTTNTPGSIFNLGTTTVTYTFTDAAGNDAFCIFDVTVATINPGDNTAPVITGCPSDLILTDIGLDGTQVATWIEPTATDESAVTIQRTNAPGDSFPLGTTPVTYTFTDTSGNFDTCSFNVIVTVVTPCDSNPCADDEQCFYSADTFLCIPQGTVTGRRRREADGLSLMNECPCLNDGACEQDHNENFRCRCQPGFFGPLCENEVVILDPCQPNPCGQNGTCRHTPRGSTISFVCDCPKGRSGRFCEIVDMKSFSDEQTTKELQQIIKNQTWMSWAFLTGCFVLVITILVLLVGLACTIPRFRRTASIRTGKPALDEITLVQ